MNKSFKVLAIVLVVLFCAGTLFAQSDEGKKAAWPAYAFSILLGFGTGQFYLGESGVGFLLGDLAGVAGVIGGSVYFFSASVAAITNPDPIAAATELGTATLIAYTIIGVGTVVTLVSRIWEVVDTIGTVDRLTKEGRVAVLMPTLDVRPNAVSFGLSYRY